MSAVATKRKILVVGGRSKNVPKWAAAAFEIEQVGQEHKGGKWTAGRADAIVVLTDFVAYEYSLQAHEVGREWGVPVLHSRGGWAGAVGQAAQMSVAWFVAGAEIGPTAEDGDDPGPVVAVSAWQLAAEDAQARYRALEHRLTRERADREKAEATLSKARSGAQQRVVAEIRRQAEQTRARFVPVVHAAAELTRTVRTAQESIAAALRDVDAARARLSDAIGRATEDG